jgi:hypothetical protein
VPIAPHGCQNSIPPLGIALISQENLPFCEGRFEAHFQGRVSTGSARRCNYSPRPTVNGMGSS